MNALGSLATVLHDDTADPTTSDTSGRALLPQLIDDWNDYVEAFHTAADMGLPAIDTDDRLMTGERAAEDADEPSFGMNALYILLLEGDTDRVLDAIASVLGRKDPQAQAFARLWKALDDTLRSEARLTSHEPQYMLDCAWQAFGKAEIWQKTALRNNAEGRAANDRLDTAMRLFSYASGGESNGVTAAHTIDAFIEQVRALAIEADSLAHTAPIDQAVTLATLPENIGN